MTNNQLEPQQRPDVNGKVVTRWVKSGIKAGAHKIFAPPPTTGTPAGTSEHSRSLFEKLLDTVVDFLLGPEEKDKTPADSELRDKLRARISEIPERTLKNLSEAWEKAKTWADKGLDTTEFGQFSERVRAQVADLMDVDEKRDETPAQRAEQIDDYAERIRRSAAAREAAQSTPARPQHEPSVHRADEDDNAYGNDEPEYSPLNDFFLDVDRGYEDSSIDDLMDNGRTRRHH
jgi:hypothetical protein